MKKNVGPIGVQQEQTAKVTTVPSSGVPDLESSYPYVEIQGEFESSGRKDVVSQDMMINVGIQGEQKGKEKVVYNDEELDSGDDIHKLWIPAPAIIANEAEMRSCLWSSAPENNYSLKNASRSSRPSHMKRDVHYSNEVQILPPVPCDTYTSDVEAGNRELQRGNKRRMPSSIQQEKTQQIHDEIGFNHEGESAPTTTRKKIQSWKESDEIRRTRQSVAAHLAELLRPKTISEQDVMRANSNTLPLQQKQQVSSIAVTVPPPGGSLSVNTPQHLLPQRRRRSLVKQVTERMPPEWVLLLVGCLIGVSSGISVVIFDKGVHWIHNAAWAGTPDEGAAWLRKQKLTMTWHRILLVPVVGGIVVGTFHSVLGVLDVILEFQKDYLGGQNRSHWLAGLKPVIKAIQAAVTLGTGCSLGPEGPSVDIGKAFGNGYSNLMNNTRERRIALVAAGAAAGIATGFNAPVAGTFFAIETVLRPQHAENSPPLTTAMIILAAVIASTVSQVLLGGMPAFTVPPYELQSLAELPLYLLLGGICGIMSVAFTRLVTWFTLMFDCLKGKIGIPVSVTPAIGALLLGLIALQYPGVLYWGFTNVNEILQTGVAATAPGQGLLAQLTVAKIIASALCKGSGLVGGLYAPSLFIGAAGGALYGSIVGKGINAALPGHNAIAHPQAYALVGMAALLAAFCSVPLTSVLLLFELTKDYHILLPLMVREAMSTDYVKVNAMATIKEAFGVMVAGRQCCALVVDENDLLEGLITPSDLQREVLRAAEASVHSDEAIIVEVETVLVASMCVGKGLDVGEGTNLVVCYSDMNLQTAENLMLPAGLHQLPVVTRVGIQWQDRGHKLVGLLHRESITPTIRAEATKRIAEMYAKKAAEEDFRPLSETH
ncbi:hypothetical protein BDL97_11G042400 [Sphagnum fallax]|nr:hypothetical protein BDL97_11G042400 [Sphagnum fallax]